MSGSMKIGMLAAALWVSSVASLSPWACQASTFDAVSARAAVDADLDQEYPHLDALYKDIHQHPELGFQELRTEARLAQEMRALGFQVTTGVGKTGVVAIYRNGAGPTVLVRTELDALPVEEKTGLPYASAAQQLLEGKMTPVDHACGHDIHMAAWVGAAHALLRLKDRWRGTLMFIGQPAEETVGGAKSMLADGLFTRFPRPDYGFALHVMNGPYGSIYYRPGIFTSNADDIRIVFHGRGAHGSMPNVSIDPVVMAARFVMEVQTVVSREKDPSAFGVVTIGALQAGTVGNVIPDHADLKGTIRSYDPGVRDRLDAGVARTAMAVAALSDAPPPEVVVQHAASAVVNDPELTARTAGVFKAVFGAKAVLAPTPIFASEDYSEFIIAGLPSTFFDIGGYDPQAVAAAERQGKPLPSNHSPYFAPVPEPTIRTGVEAMTLAVINVLTP